MRVVATKRPHPSIERLGYLQAILVEDDGEWKVADETNLPSRAEVFVHSKFNEGVDKKFRPNELIVCDVDELENQDSGDCIYGTIGTKCVPLTAEDDICSIVTFEGKLENQEHYTVKSVTRPSTFTFIKTFTEEEGEVIAGPFALVSSTFDNAEQLWETRLGTTGKSSLNFPDLEPYNVYVLPIKSLPENIIVKGNQFHSKNKSLAYGLSSFIKTAPVEKRAIVADGTLIRILDDVLNKSSKLGRKGKRDAISQIEASKKLNNTMKPALLNLFDRLDQLEKENKQVILQVFEKFKLKYSAVNVQENEKSDEIDDTIEKLQKELSESEKNRRKAESELKVVTSENEKNKNLDTSEYVEQIEQLKSELENYEKLQKKETQITELQRRKDQLEYGVKTLSESQSGLSETVARLKSELALTTSQFREKALSVLPFLEIMNNVKNEHTDEIHIHPIKSEKKFTPQSFTELVGELTKRVQSQGFQAESTWLNLVSTLYLSVKFIGFFGSPGTGKTTLATCFSNAFGKEKVNSSIVKVGRGWSSFVDFVGYDNSFTGTFKYKDPFYKKFEKEDLIDSALFYSITFDEATLSSPEFYLSNFITDADLPNSTEFEAINLDGHNIYFPKDMRFILTFNVDETTEQLSDRFISRMPIVYLSSSTESEGFEDVSFSQFDFIDKQKSDELIKSALVESERFEALRQEYDSRLSYWNIVLPDKLGARKVKQIDKFLCLAARLEDVDPSVIVDFVEEVFLMPHVKGDGLGYRELLEEILPKVQSTAARKRLAQIKNNGQKYNIFRHS